MIDPRSEVRDQREPSVQFVKDLAWHTGGIAVVGEQDSREAVRRVMTDADHYYVLGFRADGDVRPGLFRKLRVVVSRHDLEVRSQTGYYPPKTAVEAEPLPALAGAPTTAAIAGALPAGALPLRLALTSFAGAAADGRSLSGRIGVSLEAGATHAETTRLSGLVQMELRVFDGEGRREVAVVRDRRRLLPSGQLSPMPVVQVPAGRYNVRVAVVHDESQLAGSVYGTVNVADYAKDTLAASDVFVQVSGVAPDAWRAGVSAVRRVFARTEAVSVVIGVYAGRRPLAATAQIEILDAGNAVVHRDTRSVVAGGDDALTGTEVRVDLPLAGLPPGPYLAKATISAGKMVLNRNLVFAVR